MKTPNRKRIEELEVEVNRAKQTIGRLRSFDSCSYLSNDFVSKSIRVEEEKIRQLNQYMLMLETYELYRSLREEF